MTGWILWSRISHYETQEDTGNLMDNCMAFTLGVFIRADDHQMWTITLVKRHSLSLRRSDVSMVWCHVISLKRKVVKKKRVDHKVRDKLKSLSIMAKIKWIIEHIRVNLYWYLKPRERTRNLNVVLPWKRLGTEEKWWIKIHIFKNFNLLRTEMLFMAKTCWTLILHNIFTGDTNSEIHQRFIHSFIHL